MTVTPKEYIESHTSPAGEVLDAIERWAHLHTAQPQMLCGPYEGRLLTMLCRSVQARCAVEVGSYIGYSTICIASGLADGGLLHSFEVNDEMEQHIRRHLEQASLVDRVRLHIGDADKLLPKVLCGGAGQVDFAFIDAGKRQNRTFYDRLVPMMREGGIIVVDNVLWGSKVLDPDANKDADTQSVNDFNNYVQNDPRVENIMLDVRDGLLICSIL